MKRKPIVLLTLLLAGCLLFSSCAAAGLQTPALFTEFENSAKKTGQALEGLFENHTVLMENGEARYTLVAAKSLGEDVTAELAALCTAITEKTGAVIPLAEQCPENTRAIFAEVISTPTKVREYGLNDSLFRIFFSDGALHISATNEILLAEALREFTARFVTGEDAAAGNGYLGIPADTDFTAEQGTVFDETGKAQYAVLFPDGGSERVQAAATRLVSAIRELTGKDVKLKSDFSVSTGVAHEIVVGACNRQGVAEAIGTMDHITYQMTANGNDIYLLGGTDSMVEAAVNAFLSTFLEGPNPSAAKGEFTLPLRFSYRQTIRTVPVAAGGQSEYVLVYPADAGDTVRTAAIQFANYFYYLTGATLPVCSDLEFRYATAREIRVGVTNRSTPNDEMGENEWTIDTRDIIQIRAGSDAALAAALKRFTTICIRLVYSQNEAEETFRAYAPHLLYFVYGTVYRGTAG